MNHHQIVLNDLMLQDIRLFRSVASHASFVATARELGVSSTFVSKRVAALEKALGAKLLYRTSRRVRTSADGEVVLRWADKILENVDTMKDELSELRVDPKGLLRISTSQRLGVNHIAPIVSLLEKQYPGLVVWVEIKDARGNVIEEKFDLDIRVGEISEPDLIPHYISPSSRILCASRGYIERCGVPEDIQDLANHNCMVFRDRFEPFGVWRLKGAGGWETVKVSGTMSSNYSDMVLRWTHEGHGIGLFAYWDIAADLDSGKLERVLADCCQPTDLWAASAARSGNSAKVRVCLDFLKRELQNGEFALRVL